MWSVSPSHTDVEVIKVYRQTRDYENLQRMMFDGVGDYRIPAIAPVTDLDVSDWIGFNYARSCKQPHEYGVHFFIDDYQFVRLWKQPDKYLLLLSQFKALCSPDFSPYADFPKAIQLYNHFRKHWLAAFWQARGMIVIPTITWSDPSTLDWCFDGEPEGSIVALSSVGMFATDKYLSWLMYGFDAMMERLHPSKIYWRGRIPDSINRDKIEIIPIPTFTEKWRNKAIQSP